MVLIGGGDVPAQEVGLKKSSWRGVAGEGAAPPPPDAFAEHAT